jgi:ParB family transcriptional regulator, chromosome partitioning protein
MASSKPKLVLSRSQDIPFNKLVLSQSNVRRVKAGLSIEELAEDIAHRGLLQSLNVRPVLDADGVETGMFEIPAGGRRYRALEILVKQKRMAKITPVPCVLCERGDTSAEEDSLAENVQRVNLHPLDQFRGFRTLREQGLGEEEIAARFFVTPAIVKQRLRLASVSERLLDIYAEDGMTLEQLMAFTVTGDHARQEQVWDGLGQGFNKAPYTIRRLLTEGAVQASDKRAQFIGVEAYEAAGGGVTRDLFDEDDGGWLQDPALLDRLAAEKLTAAAENLSSEGWKWIAVAIDFPYGHTSGLRRLAGQMPELSTEEHASREALRLEMDRLEQDYAGDGDLPDEVDVRLGEIETALETFENRPMRYDPAEIARAGAFVSLDQNGRLRIERGFVRKEDEAPHQATQRLDTEDDKEQGTPDTSSSEGSMQRTVITIGGAPAEDDRDEEDGVKPLPDRLLAELTAHRTLALQDAVANNPHAAMTTLLHKLCLDIFRYASPDTCLEVSLRHVTMPFQAPGLKDSVSANAIAKRQEAWKAELPTDESALWDWLAASDDVRRAALLAHCVSFGINAVHEKADRYSGSGSSVHGIERRLGQANRLARAVRLDMVEAGWRPTVNSYLGRVPKARILEAVREAKGEQPAQLIGHLKKDEMAKEAERLLEGTGWLPEPLRLPDVESATEPTAEAETDGDALPAFLTGDDEPSDVGEEESRTIAAE